MRFIITTLGCKVNQYDGAAVSASLVLAGLSPVDSEIPDLVVINTCCITSTAMRKSRQAIRRAIRNAPDAAVLVIGCYSDYDPKTIARILASSGVAPERTFIAGHHDDLNQCVQQVAYRLKYRGKVHPGTPQSSDPGDLTYSGRNAGRNELPAGAYHLLSRINTSDPTNIKTRRERAVKNNVPGARSLPSIERFGNHQRAFVKVQDGCDAFCSYCIVPFTRANVYSRGADEIETECRALVAAGHKEIVLSGVFLGAFGRDTAIRRKWKDKPSALADLIRRIANIDGLWGVRLSSLESGDLTDELIATCRDLPNFAPHFHLPLQSGSERILRRMNRQYTVEEYRSAVGVARNNFDRPAITTDVIVGFPGESDEDFAATLDTARHCGFTKIHAFPFSPIQGTPAWTQRKQSPPPTVVKQRMAILSELEQQLAHNYRRQFVGETAEGLVETPRPKSKRFREAITPRYQTVRFDPEGRDPKELTGKIARFRIDETTDNHLSGTLLRVLS